MGLIDKIENKLSGSHKEDPSSNNSSSSPSSNRHTSGEHGQQQQYQRGSHEGRTSGGVSDSYQGGNSSGHHNPLQHPIGSSTGGSGITGGTMKDGVPMSSSHGGSGAGLGSAAAGAGVGGAGAYGASQYGKDVLPSGQTGVHGANVSQTSDQLRDTHLGSGQQHNTPREPFDPYSSKGQQTAANAADQRAGYGASQNRAEAGDMGSRSYASGQDVQRSPHGGVTNQVSDLKTGPHSHLENREAVPTAGGQRVGSGSGAGSGNMPGAFDSYESQGQQQHHYGRDAALAGGAGAGGVGAYEAAKHTSHGGPASKTVGPHDSNIANVMDPRVQPDRDNLRHMDSKEHRRDVGMTGAGTGAGAGAAAGYGSSHHPSTHSNTTNSSSSAPYGQNVSYMNKSASPDTPLTSTSSTGERYPPGTATTSAAQQDSHHYGRDAALAGGAGALGAGGVAAASHHQHQGTGQQGVEHGSLSSSNKTAPGMSGTSSTSAVGGSGIGSSHSASRSKGMGSAYEAGYEAGYRDAMEHVKSGGSAH